MNLGIFESRCVSFVPKEAVSVLEFSVRPSDISVPVTSVNSVLTTRTASPTSVNIDVSKAAPVDPFAVTYSSSCSSSDSNGHTQVRDALPMEA